MFKIGQRVSWQGRNVIVIQQHDDGTYGVRYQDASGLDVMQFHVAASALSSKVLMGTVQRTYESASLWAYGR